MDVKNCKVCGRLFNYMSGPRTCPSCREALEKKFSEVKEYIENNVNASMQEVSEAMEVSTQQITQWVREERLSFSNDSVVTLDCEICGAAIKTGKYCEKCKNDMLRGFNGMYKTESNKKQKTTKERDRMHFLDN